MVCHWGMSDKLGMVQYGDNNEFVFLGRAMIRSKDYSERTAQEIDGEVKKIIDEAYKVAKDIIDANRHKLELIANCLLEYETLDTEQIRRICEGLPVMENEEREEAKEVSRTPKRSRTHSIARNQWRSTT